MFLLWLNPSEFTLQCFPLAVRTRPTLFTKAYRVLCDLSPASSLFGLILVPWTA